MSRIFLSLLVLSVLVYLGLCAALFIFQRSLIYLPQPRSPGINGTTFVLPTTEANVLVSVRPHDGQTALIYFGGNAEDTSLSLPDFSSAFPDHAIYLLHYRAYGGSSGSPSEAALFKDALVLFDQVRAEHRDIVLIGRSLGSGIAVRVASVRPVSRLVLVTPYDSLQEIAATQFPYFPVRWLLMKLPPNNCLYRANVCVILKALAKSRSRKRMAAHMVAAPRRVMR
jgi:uncharacterized protein